MVIVSGIYGQLCNQLMRLSHHFANALEYDYQVNFPDFSYKSYFSNVNQYESLSSTPLLSPFEQKVLMLNKINLLKAPIRAFFEHRGYILVDQPFFFNENNESFLKDARDKKLIFINWEFRDYSSLNKHHATIKNMFSFPKLTQIESTKLIDKARTSSDVLIGVHLRRGDYATWENGKYLYGDEVYNFVMSHIVNMIPNKKVSFFLCSNESICLLNYKHYNIFLSDNQFTTDLSVLSQCDFIIGPPSTFTMWASFIGQVPLYQILQNNATPALNEFSISHC